ncbi:DUF5908 family protein [Fulvivirga ulvae]|uniref:DUF5908 family protein n=1 Tax=Fulvivirga ulvae TaxID=2904245 RepID=UPI001F36B229|nr:DUF5908 family protein [Fulvivirga ulvae]UII31372.1 DUF5908 family protein [Fulvivirga ulvae]
MAVEIKEIVIRAVLTEEEKRNSSGANTAYQKQALVRETVKEVLKVLEKKKRR